MNFFKKPAVTFAAVVAALYGVLATVPAGVEASQCLSTPLLDITAKVEDAWARYYPAVMESGVRFFPDESADASKARYEELNGLLTALRDLELDRVEDRIIRERYAQVLIDKTRAYELQAETWWGARYRADGPATPINTFLDAVKATEAGKGDEELLAYYKQLPVFIDQWIAKMDVETPDYFLGVEKLDSDWLMKTTAGWAETAREVLAAPFGTEHAEEVDAVIAALGRLAEVYDVTKSTRKLLRTPEHPSLKRLPRGEDLYAYHMMRHLTSAAPEYSPESLHEQGKVITEDLNARCLKAYGKVVNKPDANDLTEMNNWILTSPENNPYTNYTEVLDEYNRAGMKIATLLTKEFGNFPICPYTITTCFDLESEGVECRGGIAYYMRGVYKDGVCEKAGTYVLDFAPNGDTADFPKSMTYTLLMHEAVPGHHQQVMLGQEADPTCVPYFIVKASKLTVMTEGWALYSETTGFNMGAFDDPQQEIGHYQDRLLRSARLVVDTGIHHYDWSVDDCLAYLMNNTGFSEQSNRAQCERYAIYPAQALSYMVGSLAYEDARAKTEAALGEKFDPRPFHKHMLQYGDMAVDQIAELGQSFIKSQTEAPAAAPEDTTTEAESAPAESAPAEPETSSSSSGVSVGALAGGVAGGVVLGALVGAAVAYMTAKNKYTRSAAAESHVELGGK